ncbi:dolichol kinase-like isoform X2 [Lineus longissimus]|uniref:dolichol kinase-like isoform X2 n=1 Tax=Lineus longissimus TaxID=88925 RepID=UPI002B4F1EF1
MMALDNAVLLASCFLNAFLVLSCSESARNVVNIAQMVLLMICQLMGVFLESLNTPGKEATKKYCWDVRPNAQPGYIYHALLTNCLLMQSFKVNDEYWLGVSILMMVIVMSSIVTLGNLHLRQPSMTLPPPMDLWSPAHLALVFMAMCFMSNCQTGCSFFILIIVCQFVFMCVIRMVLQRLPKCFTVGEVMIVSQGFTLFLFSTIIEIILRLKLTGVGDFATNDVSYFSKIIVLTAAVICAIPSLTPAARSPLLFIILAAVIAVTLTLPLLWLGLGQNPLVWFFKYLFGKRKVFLIGYWLLGTMIAVSIVMVYNMHPSHKSAGVSTAVRKYFHIVAMAIYIPGLFYDPELLRLSSCIALAIFICLECIRILHIPPLGKLLDDAFGIFLDGQDQGAVILTHIYLLVGCSLPLWLYPENLEFTHGPPLPLFSGLISLGVGDTAASVIGSKFGRCRWPGTKKTIEGTLAAVLTQLVFCVALCSCGILPQYEDHLLAIIITIILTSLLEAFTTQIDNLVLPLFMYTCFQALCLHSHQNHSSTNIDL